MKLEGSIPAVVTPFAGGEVDVRALTTHVEWLVTEGSSAVCPCGTTGEGPTLTMDERARILRACLDAARGRVPVIAGTGTNSTRTTIEQTKQAEEAGAQAALVVTPYYNKPPQAGLVAHFRAVHDATRIPIVLYNVPGRTAITMTPETVAEVSKLPRVIAIKEAIGSADSTPKIRRLCGITILSGDDGATLAMLREGARGVISVAANVIPRAVADLCSAGLRADWVAAENAHARWAEIFQALFWETNPLPVKEALRQMGRMGAEVRLPLVPMSTDGAGRLGTVLRRLGLASV